MKLSCLLEDDSDDNDRDRRRQHAGKRTCLKLQQALIDAGDWECEFEPPKPFDRETGEIFPWIVTATDAKTGNKLKFRVHGERPHGYIFCKLSMNGKPADISVEKLAHEIKTEYQAAFDALDDEIQDWFKDDVNEQTVRDEITMEVEELPFRRRTEKVYADVRKSVKQRFIRKFLDPELRDWDLHYEVKSDRLINSKKLAQTYAEKLKDAFEDAWSKAVGEPTT